MQFLKAFYLNHITEHICFPICDNQNQYHSRSDNDIQSSQSMSYKEGGSLCNQYNIN